MLFLLHVSGCLPPVQHSPTGAATSALIDRSTGCGSAGRFELIFGGPFRDGSTCWYSLNVESRIKGAFM
jgi:hypothetical protein